MSARRSIAISLLIVLAISAFVLVGCTGPTEDATFLGYKQRPTESDPGIAIIQLENGTPAEAECSNNSLENGTPVKVTKSGDRYEIVAMSPDWGQ
jgi:hypothetical protein